MLSRTFLLEKVQIKSTFSARALRWLNSGQLYSGNHSVTFRQHCQQVYAMLSALLVCLELAYRIIAWTGKCWALPSL